MIRLNSVEGSAEVGSVTLVPSDPGSLKRIMFRVYSVRISIWGLRRRADLLSLLSRLKPKQLPSMGLEGLC